MTTRNVPESSVTSYRFVSRFVAPLPILGLVRRGNGCLGDSPSHARSPDIPPQTGPLAEPRCIGRLDSRRPDRHHLDSKRLASEVTP
jgi:hypothetical protein